jgi:hypothetical protein
MKPTELQIADRARDIWNQRGQPAGQDTHIWLEAELQLTKPVAAENSPSATAGRGNGQSQASGNPADPKAADLKPEATAQNERLRGEMASESEVEFQITPAPADDVAIKAALQKRKARAPRVPHTSAPHVKPPETGKPVWPKPHSS